MKKLAIFVTVFFAIAHIYAQKIGVVDTNYILSKLPQYKEAESRLNSQISQWQSDLQKLQADYERKREAFENEKVLLVGEQLKMREKEVVDMEASIRNTIGARFGSNGEVNQLRSNLTKPFQDQIWNAIKTVSTKNNLGIVLDKSNNISVIFLEKRYDYTDKVLDLLLKNSGAKRLESGQKSNVGSPVRNDDEEKVRLMQETDKRAEEMQQKKKN